MSKFIYFTATIFFLIIGYGSVTAQSPTSDIETVKKHLREITGQYTDFAAAGKMSDFLEKLSEDGRFADLNYTDNSAARWHWGIHWQRLTSLAVAYVRENPALDRSQLLKSRIVSGVDHWLQNGNRPKNAWWELIGVPYEMGKIFILMEREMGNERLQKILPQMNLAVRADMYYYWGPATGQNLLWEAFNHVYASALAGDHAGLKRAFSAAAKEMIITRAEGIQPDYSFHQHGAQSYAFGYGKAFSLSAAQLIYAAHGTAYALPEEKVRLISAYILDGQRWCSYRNMLEYTAMGREISRPDSKVKSILMAAQLMTKTDLLRQKELESFVNQLSGQSSETGISGNRYFPRIDFMVQQGKNFMITVKAVSKDIVSTETGNLENLKGYHLGRGTHFVVRRGNEYEGIFPLWDWEKIPGSLCEQTGKPLPVYDWTKGAQGNTDFVLGVSNGSVGCFTYDYKKDSVQAHRSWFFFENEMAMLVSALNFERPNPVFQSINQTFTAGDVFVNVEKMNEKKRIQSKISNVWHDSVSYFIQSEKLPVIAKSSLQRGSWYDINRAESEKIITKEVFTLGIDVGKSAKDASFACIIMPNTGIKAKSQLRILENSALKQLVYNKTTQTLQFVVYAPCELQLPWHKMTLSLDRAGVGVIQQKGKELEMIFRASKSEEDIQILKIYQSGKIAI